MNDIISIVQSENPRGRHLWGFLCFYGSLHRLRLCCLVLSVQPFTYVVRHYRCHNRKDERHQHFHCSHPLSAGGSTAPISYHTNRHFSSIFGLFSLLLCLYRFFSILFSLFLRHDSSKHCLPHIYLHPLHSQT